MKTVEAPPLRVSYGEWDTIERRIKALLAREIYKPILRELGQSTREKLQNAIKPALVAALQSGKVTYKDGVFSGSFDASTSKALRELGARWNWKESTFSLRASELPMELRPVIAASASAFETKLSAVDAALQKLLPAEIADKLNVSEMFDSAIWKTDKEINRTLKGISVAPKMGDVERKILAREWQRNLKLYIKDFTEKEIFTLRDQIAKRTLKGNRYGGAVKAIQESYGVSANKAKFLARQETNLMLAKLRKERYTGAGSNEYKWKCVAGTPAHPVRPSHKILDGKTFRWDDPPITTAPSEPPRHNNPGEDYNCRCFAIPLFKLKD